MVNNVKILENDLVRAETEALLIGKGIELALVEMVQSGKINLRDIIRYGNVLEDKKHYVEYCKKALSEAEEKYGKQDN